MRKSLLEITWKINRGGSYTQYVTDAQTSLLIFMIRLDWSLVPSSSRSPGLARKVRAYLPSSEGTGSPVPQIPKHSLVGGSEDLTQELALDLIPRSLVH